MLFAKRSAPLPMTQAEPENEALTKRVENLLYTLAVSGGVGFTKIYRLAGAHPGDRIGARMDVEQQRLFARTYREGGQLPSPLTRETFFSASRFAGRLDQIRQEHIAKSINDRSYWRFISGFSAFLDGCRTRVDRYDVRLHQSVRAIESFLPSNAYGADKFAQYVKRLVTDS